MQTLQSEKSVFGLDLNVAAGLAYLPVCLCHLIVSIGILAADKTNKLPRFHAVQSLLISATIMIGSIVAMVVMMIFGVIAAAAQAPALMILSFLIYFVFLAFVLACMVGSIICMINAFQGKIFKLPLIGNMADKWSS
jgi:uncharacterized membrane protein